MTTTNPSEKKNPLCGNCHADHEGRTLCREEDLKAKATLPSEIDLEEELDRLFPKGKCKERGQALVLYADAKMLITLREQAIKEQCEKERYWSPCDGCKDGHPSFWKTVIESPQWKLWRKEQWRRWNTKTKKGCYDMDEVEETGIIGAQHFQDFLKFVSFLREQAARREAAEEIKNKIEEYRKIHISWQDIKDTTEYATGGREMCEDILLVIDDIISSPKGE